MTEKEYFELCKGMEQRNANCGKDFQVLLKISHSSEFMSAISHGLLRVTGINVIAIIVQQTKLLTWKSEVPTNSCYFSMYVVCTIYTYYLDLSTILVRISGQWKKPKRLSVRLFSTGCEFISHLVCGYFLKSPILNPTIETHGN